MTTNYKGLEIEILPTPSGEFDWYVQTADTAEVISNGYRGSKEAAIHDAELFIDNMDEDYRYYMINGFREEYLLPTSPNPYPLELIPGSVDKPRTDNAPNL